MNADEFSLFSHAWRGEIWGELRGEGGGEKARYHNYTF